MIISVGNAGTMKAGTENSVFVRRDISKSMGLAERATLIPLTMESNVFVIMGTMEHGINVKNAMKVVVNAQDRHTTNASPARM